MDQRDLFLGHMDDLSNKAEKTGYAVSKFLTPAEREMAAEYFKRRHDTGLTFEGGYEKAERVRGVFTNRDWGTYELDDLFTALQISVRTQDSLGHRDILGALMSLGLRRDTIGDIVTEGHVGTLLCLPEFSLYIVEQLTQIGRLGITIETIPLEAFPAKTETMRIKTDTVSSLRLDAVLSAAFDVSRSKAAALITSGHVSLNHLPCLQIAKEVPAEAVLSIRKQGRAKLVEVGGMTKKGRIAVKIGRY